MFRAAVMLLLAGLGCLAAGPADAATRIKVDVDLRNERPRITRFRRIRRFGWHSGAHYAPYVNARGQHVAGWHTGSHQDWYFIDVPLLDRVNRGDWEVYARLGKGKSVRFRGDLRRKVERKVRVVAPRGTALRWVGRDGNVILRGRGGRVHRRFVGNGWDGVYLGDSIILMNLPGTPDVEVYLKQRTKDLAADENGKPEEKTDEEVGHEKRGAERDKLLDDADAKFIRGLYPQAALLYQKAMKVDETDAIARFAVAHSLFALGAYKTAGKNVRMALDEMPDWPGVDLDLRQFYREQGLFEAKLNGLKEFVRQHPEDADAKLLLGYCYHFSGRQDAALEIFNGLAGKAGGDKEAELFLNLSDFEVYREAVEAAREQATDNPAAETE